MRVSSREEAVVLETQAAEATAEAEHLAIASRTVQAPVLPLERTAAPPKHVVVGQKWTYRVDDLEKLIKHVAAGTGNTTHGMLTFDHKVLERVRAGEPRHDQSRGCDLLRRRPRHPPEEVMPLMTLSTALLVIALILCALSFTGRVPLAASVLFVIVERLVTVWR